MADAREAFKEDGTPDLGPWAREIARDWGAIAFSVGSMVEHGEEPSAEKFAYMLKEARRMESDLYRMAKHAGFNRAAVDGIGPL